MPFDARSIAPLLPAPARAPRAAAGGLLWLLPLAAVALIAGSGLASANLLIAALAALVVVIFAARRPDRALLILIVGLPFQTLLLAKLYAWGVPDAIIRPLSGWKEALGIGMVVAGFLGYQRSGRSLDRLDWIAISFIAIALTYALLPRLFSLTAPTDPGVRSLAFRQTAGFVILFLGARHALLPAGFLGRATRAVFAVGALVAAIAIYEYFFSSQWNDFIVNNIKLAYYQVQVLHVFPLNALDYRVYGHIAGQEIIRVGSVFQSPLTCGFYLLFPLAIGIERVVRRGARPHIVVALFAIGGALIVTQTRSAIIGALVIAVCAFRFAPGRRGGRRIQFGAVLLVGVLLALPAAASTGLTSRAETTASSDDPGATDHLEAMRKGLVSIADHPLGLGIGTSAGTGQRFAPVTLVSESNYVEAGTEFGIVGMALFIGLTLGLIRQLRRATLAVPNAAVAATWTAAIGLAVAAFFLHALEDFAVSWTLWGLAGAALGVATRERERAEQPPAATDGPG